MTVEVPATVANLGPGFDCFGLALDWYERILVEVLADGYHVDVSGESAEELPRDESHLIIRSALVGLADLGVEVPGLRLRCRNTIPHGRGLGSSSAAIVGGLVAAAALAGAEPDRHWLLGHACAIEGHPDNVAAAIHGGLVLAYESDGIKVAQPLLHPDVAVAVFIPETRVGTAAARNLLPEVVPHADAAANSGRAALLLHALTAEPDLLLDATRDWLHQSYREPVMPQSYELVKTLRSKGFAAVISGAGPTVLVLGRHPDMESLDTVQARGFRWQRLGIGGAAGAVERGS